MQQRRECPRCGARVEPLAIGCDECRVVFSEWEREQSDRLEGLSEHLKAEIAEQAWLRLRKSVGLWMSVLGAAVTLGLGASLWGIYNATIDFVKQDVAHRFAEPQVAETFNRVAEGQAQEILKTRVEPAVQGLETFVHDQEQSLKVAVDGVRSEFEGQLAQVKQANDYQQQMVRFQKIAARAKAGNAASWEELLLLRVEQPSFSTEIDALILEVRGFYIGKGISKELPQYRVPGATVPKAEMTPRRWLYVLANDQDLVARYNAASNVSGYVGVPEALLKAAKNDTSLWVRYQALETFYGITGATPRGALAVNEAETWYAEHSAEVASKLRPMPDDTPDVAAPPPPPGR